MKIRSYEIRRDRWRRRHSWIGDRNARKADTQNETDLRKITAGLRIFAFFRQKRIRGFELIRRKDKRKGVLSHTVLYASLIDGRQKIGRHPDHRFGCFEVLYLYGGEGLMDLLRDCYQYVIMLPYCWL